MKKCIIFIFITLLSCSTRHDKKDTQLTQKEKRVKVYNDSKNRDTEIIETFTDSTKIGEKGKSKIEIIKHRVFDGTYVIVNFYTKGPNCWYIKNTYLYECDAILGLEPNISDFNNDKFNDLTFISAEAARGSNEVRRLFIYDDAKKKLISIVNSEEFPNMQYNDELDCIDAFLVTGGTTTVFARLKGDSLIEFAGVDNSDYRLVYVIDKKGEIKYIKRDKITDDMGVYVRYKNYKPLKEYN
ncbi:MAG: hypothetical protein PHR83_00010 [Paludibacter sp.]|nr:hypothetical protein [Paludibacter sp.]